MSNDYQLDWTFGFCHSFVIGILALDIVLLMTNVQAQMSNQIQMSQCQMIIN